MKQIYKLFPNSLRKKQFFWDILGKLSQFYPENSLKKIPKEIIIEPTNSCNLRCPVCPTHFAMKRKRGFMDFDLFKSIIDELKVLKYKPKINFNFSGEPLLNQNLGKYIQYANSNGHHTFVSTNATLMTEERAKQLIKSGLGEIHLCMDGFSKESQEGYRVGSNFETVKKNIENFHKVKNQLGYNKPHTSIQTLLTSFSENEMEDMIKWGREIGADEINFKSLSMGSYTTDEMKAKYDYLLPKNKKLRRKVTSVKKSICMAPIDQALVYWNGDLGLCCVDFDNVLKLDNIKEKGFIKTFTSQNVIKRRKSGFQKKYSLCENCSLGNADSMGFNVKLK